MAFHLEKLLQISFAPKAGENVTVLTDVPHPGKNSRMREVLSRETQSIAYQVFYQELLRLQNKLHLGDIRFFIFKTTKGSNLDLPASVYDLSGKKSSFRSALNKSDIVIAPTTHSATAPLKNLASLLRFRAATMHGVTKGVLKTGLSVDYSKVSQRVEKFMQFMKGSKSVLVEYTYKNHEFFFQVFVDDRKLGKDDGIYHQVGEVGNLPTGEIFYVPNNATGTIPLPVSDDAIALFSLKSGALDKLIEYSGQKKDVLPFIRLLQKEPRMRDVVELGFGTEQFPFLGADIQDEKILGTVHLALGRNDFLGGKNSPDTFRDKNNAIHKDILYHPKLIPEMMIKRVAVFKSDEKPRTIIERFKPTKLLLKSIES